MFNELIYTRCRQGVDITRKGSQISGDGYKVYSCAPAIMEEGTVDLPLLANAAQAKQSYADPGFMDDAYLFYVPDFGAGFFINFYPIPFDANAKGDYSHRPGNFINHALIGDFSQDYPYKMFQDEGVWYAKTKGEAYYYENPPADLPERGITNLPGRYSYDEIRAFIADGREEALKKAVAFLIAQYKEEPEKRKYLVIRDDSSKNIELWIAAIECAFSPRIASTIPFATRMDKFVNINRYTVKNDIYQTQMNLQDPSHKQRYRAMIVGVDERDKANVSSSRPLPNSPFVLLDGKQKQAMFEADISHDYYRLVTKFDGEHQKFCSEFLQTFNVLKPSAEIHGLYEIYTVFYKPSIADARTLSNTLDRLNKYQAANTAIYREIYNQVNNEATIFMQKDFSCALNITDWLLSASKITGDTGAKQRLTDVVRNAFTGIVFSKTDNKEKRSLWEQIRRTAFAMDAAHDISDIEKIKENSPNLKTFSPNDIAAFISIYVDCVLLTGGNEQQNVVPVVKFGIEVCCRNNDINSMQEIVSSLSRVKNINIHEFLFALVKSGDKGFGEFVIEYIISRDASIFTSDNSTRSFCKKLNGEGLGHLAGSALMRRVTVLNKPSEMELFIEAIHDMDFIGDDVKAKIYESIDAKLDTATADKLVKLVQTQKPKGAKCKNSAHLLALSILSGSRKEQNLIEAFTDLINQGFPAITDENYIHKLAELMVKAGMDEKEQLFILKILVNAPKGYFSAYLNKLISVAEKNKDKWNTLFMYTSESGNKQIEDVIVQALVDSRQSEKSLNVLGSILKDENTLKYYDSVAGKAWEIISTVKSKSVFGKLLGKK